MAREAPTRTPATRTRFRARARKGVLLAAAATGVLAIAGCGADHFTAASDKNVEQSVKAKIRSLAAGKQVALSELGCYELTAAKMLCTAEMSGSGISERTTATFSANFENTRDRNGPHTFVLEGPPEILGS